MRNDSSERGVFGLALSGAIAVLALAVLGAGLGAAGDSDGGTGSERADGTSPEETIRAIPPEAHQLAQDLARAITNASPPADAGDARARDRAARALSRLGVILDATEEGVLWGAFDADRGYEPSSNHLIGLAGPVWARLYLSCFLFEGKFEIRQEGPWTIAELPARFRSGLVDGDYPHPLWHSPSEWRAYTGATSLLLVIEDMRLIAAYFKSAADAEPPDEPDREWDKRWTWNDSRGDRQPRVAQFEYLLSPDNPHAANLERAYRELESYFESQTCLQCHSPANRGRARVLYLLEYPNQSLAMRESLVQVLTRNSMPPASAARRWARGIQDEDIRLKMLAAAQTFRDEANAALSYEEIYTIRPEEYPAP